MKRAHWGWLNTLITWAIASAGFFYTQSRHMTTIQTIAMLLACLTVAMLANLGIEAARTHNRS